MGILHEKKVAILLSDGFEQVEMTKPRDALIEAGAEVTLIAPKKTVMGWNHHEKADSFPVDVLIEEANPDDYDALVLPGGVINPDTLRLIPQAIEFIKTIGKSNKPIAAICHGPWTLISAELTKNLTITSWPSLRIDLENSQATWVDKEVVRDGKFVTSRKPDDIPAFNAEMIKLFAEG